MMANRRPSHRVAPLVLDCDVVVLLRGGPITWLDMTRGTHRHGAQRPPDQPVHAAAAKSYHPHHAMARRLASAAATQKQVYAIR